MVTDLADQRKLNLSKLRKGKEEKPARYQIFSILTLKILGIGST